MPDDYPKPRPFEYLLNAMEAAGRHEKPATVDYYGKRKAVFEYVSGLLAQIAELQRDANAQSEFAHHATVMVERLRPHLGLLSIIPGVAGTFAQLDTALADTQAAAGGAAGEHRHTDTVSRPTEK